MDGLLYVVTIITSLYSSQLSTFMRHKLFLRFEVFTEVTMKNAVFWDVTPCGYKNRCLGGTQRLHHQGDKNL
jgi:hypothetical protein